MKITSARFIKSCPSLKDCPKADRPEYAFIGRSNVGKSSLINMLTGHGRLAKTSTRPGKTQLINHFMVNEAWYLVDLPGYGFAKVSKDKRASFDQMISSYIRKRENLMCVFVLVDSRHEPQTADINFLVNLGEASIPFCLVFTKCDKVPSSTLPRNISAYTKFIKKHWEEMPLYFLTSSITKKGREEILDFIEESNTEYRHQ